MVYPALLASHVYPLSLLVSSQARHELLEELRDKAALWARYLSWIGMLADPASYEAIQKVG